MIRIRILAFLLPGLAILAACRQAPSNSTAQSAAFDPSTPIAGSSQGLPALSSTREPIIPANQITKIVTTPKGTSTATQTPKPIEPFVVDFPPTASPTEEVPPPVEPFPLPPDVEVMVMLGLDEEDTGVARTDTILLVFYNLHNGTASMVSVPRDLYVYLPGLEMNRINTAFYQGGFDLLALTFEYNLGVRPSHWVAANFSDFVRFIDDLGGINVPVSNPMPEDCGGIPPGKVHMDGTMALCYLRERRTTSDIDRSRRQQEVLQVILDRVIALETLRHLPEWYERYRESVMTDLTLPDLLPFVPLVLKLPDSGLEKYQISWNEVEAWKVPASGAQVFLPQRERIKALLNRAVARLSSSVASSSAYEERLAALTATATPPELPAEPGSSETEEPVETPTPTLIPALADPSPYLETPTLAYNEPPP